MDWKKDSNCCCLLAPENTSFESGKLPLTLTREGRVEGISSLVLLEQRSLRNCLVLPPSLNTGALVENELGLWLRSTHCTCYSGKRTHQAVSSPCPWVETLWFILNQFPWLCSEFCAPSNTSKFPQKNMCSLIWFKSPIRQLLKHVPYFSACSDSKRSWVSFASLMSLFSVSWFCKGINAWSSPFEKDASAQPQPFGWEISALCKAGFSSLTAQNCSAEVEGRHKVLTADRKYQWIAFTGNISSVGNYQFQQIICFNWDSLKEPEVEEASLSQCLRGWRLDPRTLLYKALTFLVQNLSMSFLSGSCLTLH